MHPAFLYWWKYGRRQAEWDAWAYCGPSASGSHWQGRRYSASHHHESPFGPSFGVRRPLRFLAYKLDLSEEQMAELARILDEIKTERAQAEVDGRRTATAFADAVEGDTFDEARAGDGATLRVQSAERLRDAVVRALRRIHALLDAEQRKRLAYLVRTGALAI
jgi:Spy/CpxP family protein refolding chaperone